MFCLQVWRGFDCGPGFHSIHFSFAFGSFISPLIAAPFLSQRSDLITKLEAEGANQTDIDKTLEKLAPTIKTKIGYLFPLLGGLILSVAAGYFVYGIKQLKQHGDLADTEPGEEASKKHNRSKKQKITEKVMIALLMPFFFIYVGAEYTMGTYIASFAVLSKLHLTKVQGSNLTAIFWGGIACMRFITIFAAMKFNALIIMIFCMSLSIIGALLLVFCGQLSALFLQIGVGILGFGMASIYATGFVWLEQYIFVTNKIGAAFGITEALGPNVFPTVLGQFIEQTPMVLMYENVGSIAICSVLFTASVLLSRILVKQRKEHETEEEKMRQEELSKHIKVKEILSDLNAATTRYV